MQIHINLYLLKNIHGFKWVTMKHLVLTVGGQNDDIIIKTVVKTNLHILLKTFASKFLSGITFRLITQRKYVTRRQSRGAI